MELTLGFLTLGDVAPNDLVLAAADGGFTAVGLRVTGRRPGDAHFPVVGHPAKVREIKQRLADTGVRLSNISSFQVTPELTIDDVLPVIEVTAELGARIMIANRFDPDDRRYAELMRAYCRAAAQAGIRVALEFMRYSACRDLDGALNALALVGEPNMGLMIDALHLSRAGGVADDLRKVAPRHIILAQLCDARGPAPADMAGLLAEARDRRLPPGEGDLPLDDFLDALPPDVELEAEVPMGGVAHLPAGERARRIGESCRAFLAGYRARRGDRGWRGGGSA